MRKRIMRLCILALVLSATIMPAIAEAKPFQAGMTRIAVLDVEPFDALVWYPTDAAAIDGQAGLDTTAARREAVIASGERFPVVLLSHGHGGSPFGHRDLAIHLARDGFIVVAPVHVGDSSGRTEGSKTGRALMDRPRQARLALDAALADPRFAPRADPARIGMIGFSAGGYTTLILAGARPNFVRASAYCREHTEDVGSCGAPKGSDAGPRGDLAQWRPQPEPRLKAMVLMDPLAIMFDAESLVPVRIPTLLYRPENDAYLRAQANASAVAAGLPQPPQQIVVPGRHFVFLDPCPPKPEGEAPDICRDAPGIDRAAIHRRMEGEIAAFLHANL